jgi:indolepyruvate ferredoxin oxidoreductase
LLLACDIVSAVGITSYETLNPKLTSAVVNTNNTPVADFVTNNEIDFHQKQVRDSLLEVLKEDGRHFVPATEYAQALMGDEIATNIFVVGYAWQKGLIPLTRESIERAMELNGVAIEANKKAFNYGRLAAHNLPKIEELVQAVKGTAEVSISNDLETLINKRSKYLRNYQNKSYADRYLSTVVKVREAEEKVARGHDALTEAVARYLHKLMAYKDEYEVARLYTDGDLLKKLK